MIQDHPSVPQTISNMQIILIFGYVGRLSLVCRRVEPNGVDIMTKDYMPCSFPEELMDPVEWIHCLATLDTTVLQPRPKFCDDDGYDVHPLHMIDVVNSEENESQVSNLLVDEVSVEDIPTERVYPSESEGEFSDIPLDDDNWEVPEEELEKIRLLLKHREPVDLSVDSEKKPRRFCKSHQKLRRREIQEKKDRAKLEREKEDKAAYGPPTFEGKTEYLYYVGAEDCVKME